MMIFENKRFLKTNEALVDQEKMLSIKSELAKYVQYLQYLPVGVVE